MLTKVKNLENINDFPKVGLIHMENSGEKLLSFYLEKIFHLRCGSNIKYAGDPPQSNWIISSDFPSRTKSDYYPAEAASAILLVRNPLDIVMSKVMRDSLFLEEALTKIDLMIEEWREFHKFWIHAPLPVHLVRYEDLVTRPEDVLKHLCKFLVGTKSLENCKLDYLIKSALAEKVEKSLYAYDLESEESGKHLFTEESVESIHLKFQTKLGKLMVKFNYETNEDGSGSNWMATFNLDSMVKSVEFNDFLNMQYLTASYINVKLC